MVELNYCLISHLLYASMKLLLFPLAIIFYFSDIAQNSVVQYFDSPILITVKGLKKTGCESQEQNFVVEYSAPTVLIKIKNFDLNWTEKIEEYKNPISAAPTKIITQTKNKKLTSCQLEKLQKLIQTSGFMNLAAEYGAPNNQRYYPYSISVTLGKKENKVIYRSNPTYGSSPEAFRIVEDYLHQLIK